MRNHLTDLDANWPILAADKPLCEVLVEIEAVEQEDVRPADLGRVGVVGVVVVRAGAGEQTGDPGLVARHVRGEAVERRRAMTFF